ITGIAALKACCRFPEASAVCWVSGGCRFCCICWYSCDCWLPAVEATPVCAALVPCIPLMLLPGPLHSISLNRETCPYRRHSACVTSPLPLFSRHRADQSVRGQW